MKPLDVGCPQCHARFGEPCINLNQDENHASWPHKIRKEIAREIGRKNSE